MVETKAQRTLVKSPPELWAELSDPASLARHLGELSGEITITRIEPETTVVWEGERATGRVELAPSGWGTKVTLTLATAAPDGVAPSADSAQADGTPTDAAPAASRPVDTAQMDTRPAESVRADNPPAETPPADTPPADTPTAGSAPTETPPADNRTAGSAPAETPPAPAHSAPTETPPADNRTADGAPESEDGRLHVVADAERVGPPGGSQRLAAADAPMPSRRGFFARLFGRRQRAEDSPGNRREIATDAAAIPEPAPRAPDSGPGGAAPVPAAAELTAADTEAVPPTLDPPDAATATATADTEPVPPTLDPPDAATATATADTEPTARTLDATDAAPVTATADTDPTARTLDPPDAAPATATADRAADGSPPVATAVAEAATDEQPAAAAAGDGRLDGGLDPERASELLVGVLDALGAAHHRPFSRG